MTTTATAAKQSVAVLPANGASDKPQVTKADSLKRCTEALNRMVTAVRSTFQSLDKMEPAIHAAMLPALEHARLFRDARPVDRIIRSIIDIGHATKRDNQARILVAETRAWVRANSPIRWEGTDWRDAKVNVSGKNEFTTDKAAETPFYKTESAVKQRAMSAANTEANLAAIVPATAMSRLNGMLKWFNNVKTEKNPDGTPRAIAKADKIEKAIKAAIEAASDVFTKSDLDIKPETVTPVNEAKVKANVSLLKKGSRKHRDATAKARKAKASANGATQAQAAA